MNFGKLGARGGFGSLGSLGRAGNSGPAPYLGQVATRSQVANFATTASKQFNSRSAHTSRVAISSLQVVLPNFWVNGSLAEVGTGAPATVTASIEYPVGTFTQLKFSGSASGSIPDDSTLVSDVAAVSIPVNTQFFVRVFWTSTTGLITLTAASTGSAATFVPENISGEALSSAPSGLSDLTLGGTITDTTSFLFAYRPIAIIGQTTAPSVLLIGDSRQYGIQNTAGGSSTNVPLGEFAGSIDPVFGYINASCPSDRVAFFLASSANRVALARYVTGIGCEYGINDANAGATSAQMIAGLQSLINLFPGKQFFQSTIDPNSNAGNTAPNIPAANTQRIAFNTALRGGTTGVTGLTGVFDTASVTESSLNSGLWTAGLSTDFLHPNAVGYAAITSSGVINSALIHR